MTFRTTRRTLLTTLAGTAASGALPGLAWPQVAMQTREIPRTGERLPIIGLGSTRPVSSLPALGTDRVEAIVRSLVQHGGRVIDTWPRDVANDTAFGDILNAPEWRDRLFVTINLDQPGAAGGAQQFEQTLRAYRRESIDLVNVGSLIDLDVRWPVLREWRDAGRARYIGVTAAQAALYPQLETFLADESPDFVEINYSVTEREAERLLPRMADRGIAVLVSRPFMNGAYFERLANVPLPPWAEDFECESWAQFSLQYILANPAVTCVLTETTRAEHMTENLLTAFKPAPSEMARRRMRELIDGV